MSPSTAISTALKAATDHGNSHRPSGEVVLPTISVSLSPEEKFREYLVTRSRPQRFTDQQRDMVRFIFAQHEHFDADTLIDDMKRAGLTVSRATAYRTLTKLVDAGLLRRHETGGRTRYEHDYGYPHHDHLHCQTCGNMIEFQVSGIDSIIREAASQHGFQATGHSFIVQGTCSACRQMRVAQRRLDRI